MGRLRTIARRYRLSVDNVFMHLEVYTCQLQLFTTAPGFHSLLGLFFHHVTPFHMEITLTQFTIDYSGVYRVNFVRKILKYLYQNVRKYILICIYIYYVIINQFRYGRRG